MRLFLLVLLFASFALSLPRSSVKNKVHKISALTKSHKSPKSEDKNWKNDLTADERATLVQLESEVTIATDENSKRQATYKHHRAALHMITERQKKQAVTEFHARQKTRTKEEPTYEKLPDDIKQRLVPDDNGGYIIHGNDDVTDLYFKYEDSSWYWSPDRVNWMSVGSEIVSGGDWDGKSPTQANINLLDRLHSLQEGIRSLSDRKYDEVKWFFRVFISTDFSEGHWMDEQSGCSDAPHEYVAPLPRVPGMNLMGYSCFCTDSRTYSADWDARARINFKVIFDTSGVTINPEVTDATGELVTAPYCDYTTDYTCKDALLAPHKCGHENCHDRASSDHLHIDNLICYDGSSWSDTCDGNSKLATFHILGDPKHACGPPGQPSIDLYGGFTLAVDGHLYGDGAVDAFPWYESGVVTSAGGVLLYQLAPEPGKTPFNLIGGANRVISVSGSF